MCRYCKDPRREEIDAAISSGVSFRKIAETYGGSASTVSRHRAHMEQVSQPEKRLHESASPRDLYCDALLNSIRNLQARVFAILGRAESAGDLKTALNAVKEARANVEFLMKFAPDKPEEQSVDDVAARIRELAKMSDEELEAEVARVASNVRELRNAG